MSMSEKEKLPQGWIKVRSKKRPDKCYYYHEKKKISVWKLSDCSEVNGETKINITKSTPSPIKTPSKSPKKESKILKTSKVIGKRNLANERLKKLQNTLKEEVKRGNVNKLNPKDELKRKEPSQTGNVRNNTTTKKPQENGTPQKVVEITKNDSIVKEISFKSSLNEANDESTQMEVDDPLDKSVESLKDYEPMEWEDIDVKLVVQEVQNIRTKQNVVKSSYFSNREKNGLSRNVFYILVDTNVFLSNLSFVKQIKGRIFKDIGRAYIYLPYIVLCELDRLKMREENIARLARTAISFIDGCFNSKDEYLFGQNAMESSRELIKIDSGDDYIINSALQLKEYTSKIILLSNDKNLRNKMFVNGIEAFSSDTLNHADYNISNTIKFE